MKNLSILFLLVLFITANCSQKQNAGNKAYDPALDTLKYEQEKHLKNVRQLTFGHDNAEAYWSYDNTKLIFQSNNPEWGAECDQIYYMDIDPKEKDFQPSMVSTGEGRTTCSFFMPGDSLIVYSTTHLDDPKCPPQPDYSGNAYVWPIYSGYDIVVADLRGNIRDTLTHSPGYDAEPTLSPDGSKIVFTSMRSGDLELYIMNTDGSDLRQITDELGYDGGAFFSPDGKQLVFRASRPKTEDEISQYKSLLEKGLVQPTEMELFIVNVDGTGLRQITDLGNANWAPYFHPSGEKIIFSSNHTSERGFPFNLYMINTDGTGLEQITFDNTFDSFPMFSYDGKQLVFGSNRFNGGDRSTNIFIADWVE